jgi:hypothetical protein
MAFMEKSLSTYVVLTNVAGLRTTYDITLGGGGEIFTSFATLCFCVLRASYNKYWPYSQSALAGLSF